MLIEGIDRCGRARLLVVVAAVLLGTATFIPLPSSAEAMAVKKCGTAWATKPPSTYSSFKVRAKRIGCGKARTLVKKAWRSAISTPGESARIGRYRCAYVSYFGTGNVALRCKFKKRVALGLWTRDTV